MSAPSTKRLVPLIRLARGLANITTAYAVSSGVPIRPVGFSASEASNSSRLFCSTFSHTPPSK